MKSAQKFYCTYKWRLLHGNRSRTQAIEAKTLDEAWEIARDIYSINGAMYVNVNKCGRLPKDALVIANEDYYNGKFYNME